MFRRLKELYDKYRDYVCVDLVMYAVMLLLIFFYILYTLVSS